MAEKLQFNFLENCKSTFGYFANQMKKVPILHLAIISAILLVATFVLLMPDIPCRNKRVETIGNVIEVGTRCLD
jgi:hypothetical protein